MTDAVTRFEIEDRDREEARKGAGLLSELVARGGLFLTDPSGQPILIEMPLSLLRAVHDFLDAIAQPGETLVFKAENEVSPEMAAEILGISRPLVYRRMDVGKLPFRQVGTHRRIRVADVARLKQHEEQRRKAAAELAADTEDLEANYAETGNRTP
ncbi:helix-turn-helix domain-containing protein [Bradyrhizobium brasilense]|uniref:helix-turn-helix domain-containing protein n=1 Tax=Bradyrhizobium brasilense TaxID=1419277 RepID=UPI0024B1A9BE|nr:helix-turn-helix domain-containing protein [Bradyrhizobium australafricanum]WFU31458.1 helix-turn-helix domain-containing protein [Bradyrhizobium australafricanum]